MSLFNITGTMQAAANTQSYIIPGGDLLTGGAVLQGFNINATLSASAGRWSCSTGPTAGQRCKSPAAPTPFRALGFYKAAGCKEWGDGTGYNSLGASSSIIINPTFDVPGGSPSNEFNLAGQVHNPNSALLDLGAATKNSSGSLTITNNGASTGQMWLHGQCIFSSVLITNGSTLIGSNLANGYYAYATLNLPLPTGFRVAGYIHQLRWRHHRPALQRHPASLVRVQKLIPIYSRKEGVIPFGQDRVFE